MADGLGRDDRPCARHRRRPGRGRSQGSGRLAGAGPDLRHGGSRDQDGRDETCGQAVVRNVANALIPWNPIVAVPVHRSEPMRPWRRR
jgi:hypothetical protein